MFVTSVHENPSLVLKYIKESTLKNTNGKKMQNKNMVKVTIKTSELKKR